MFRRSSRQWAFLLALAVVPWIPAEAQQGPREPFGFWGEVVSVTDKWLVVANERGQQFPIALGDDTIGLFIVRWPTTPDRLNADFVMEASGLLNVNNEIVTNHVDVFRGRSLSLVNETSQPLVEARPLFDPMNVMMMNIFGPVYYLPPRDIVQPRTIHAVGNWFGSFPLRMVQGGNVVYPIVAETMTEVTPGSPSMVEPGDTVFCFARGNTVRTLQLDQLIVYKSVAIDQFAAP